LSEKKKNTKIIEEKNLPSKNSVFKKKIWKGEIDPQMSSDKKKSGRGKRKKGQETRKKKIVKIKNTEGGCDQIIRVIRKQK